MTLFVIAGEKSGDAIAAKVLQPLAHTVSISGVIGPKLKEIGATQIFSIEAFEVMGIVDILKSLPHFISLFYKIKKAILQDNPNTVLLVDNAEFSLAIAKSLRKSGYKGKIVQLISPSVWAWRKNRIKTLEQNFDLLLSIFPFEKKYFSNSSLRVEYVGHPLIDELKEHIPSNQIVFPNKKPIIAIFPGSRKKETTLNLSLQLQAVKDLDTHQVAISVASKKLLPVIENLLKKSNVQATLVFSEDRYELMQKAEFALSKLGTVNLELAYFKVPTITSFPLPRVEQFLLQHIFKVFLPHYSIVNLLAERRVFPEYIASFATLGNLKMEVHNFAKEPQLREWSQSGCRIVKEILEKDSFSKKTANLLLDF